MSALQLCRRWFLHKETNIDRKSAISLQRSQFDPKFQVEGVALHHPFFFSDN